MAYTNFSSSKSFNNEKLSILLKMILELSNSRCTIYEHIVQTSGTLMETRIGPNYASIIMGPSE